MSGLKLKAFAGLMALGLCVASMAQSSALAPDEHMARPDLESRALSLYREVRCVVCQNEADSSAELAATMRRDIRERLSRGESDETIRQALSARYGDFVLFRPPFNGANLILWGLPVALVLLGGLVFFRQTRSALDDEAA